MACTPTPTSTVFSTSTSTSFTLTTITTSEVNTITSTSTAVWTSCLVENATASGTPACLSSTVGTSSNLIPIVTTVPITQTNTVPVNVPVQVPIQTLFSDCPSDGNSQVQQQSSSQQDDSSSSTITVQSGTRVTITSFITYSDSGGVHVSQSASVSDGGQLDPGGNGNSSSKANLGPIIGGVVGGVVAILALIGLVWYILWRRDQNRFLFDEDEDGVYRPKSVGRRTRRSLNLDDETKGLDTSAYQYGVVGSTASPSTSPVPRRQFSSLGEYSHRRSLSREALMTAGGPSSSISNSPQRLDIPLGRAQRRISENTSSSTRGESIMMTNQPVQNRPSDDTVPWGHHPRPSSSLLEAPMVYPPGATSGTGFYQQYGPLESQPAGATGSTSPAATAAATASRSMHKPPLDPPLIPASQPLATHQSLLAAAGLAESSTSRVPVIAAPPPGAAGARPYVEHQDPLGDMHSAVMASADRVATGPTPSTGSAVEVGFGRQRRPEKTPRVEASRSSVMQHEDAGRAPASNAAQEAPPPAYSPS